jgi:hypothetical protein
MPKITSVEKFEDMWVQWWTAAQPEWRDTSCWPFSQGEVAGDWGRLLGGGKNGLFLVVMSLGWWTNSRDPAVASRLDAAIRDVCWVTKQLVASLSARVISRDASPGPSVGPSRPRRQRVDSGNVQPPKKRARA